jgi:type IV secretion system protein VirB10
MQDEKNQPQPQADTQSSPGEPQLAGDRAGLFNRQRTRLTGGTKASKRGGLMALALIGGTAFLFLVVKGPTGAMRALGLIGGGDRQTSSTSMEVNHEKNRANSLDFVVPAAPEAPTVNWAERFKELQDKLAAMERNKEPNLSAGDVREMLSKYNETLTRRFDEERKAMADENARLRLEAQRTEEEKRRAEEEANRRALSAKERQEIEKKQRQSSSIIVDEGSQFSGAPAGSAVANEDKADLDANQRFLKSAASSVVQTSVSQKLYDPSRMVVQGTIISAVLETAIDTQLPGNLRAQVMQPVYSFDGSRILMPPGTMLIGQFNNAVDIAQKRVLIAWNRAVTPDGKSIAIGSTGTDTLGRAGTLGNVDNRYGTKFGAAMLISVITAIPSALSKQGSDSKSSSGTTVNVGSQVGGKAGDSLSDQTSGIMGKYLSLPPVIRIPQGEEIRVFVNQDLIFR